MTGVTPIWKIAKIKTTWSKTMKFCQKTAEVIISLEKIIKLSFVNILLFFINFLFFKNFFCKKMSEIYPVPRIFDPVSSAVARIGIIRSEEFLDNKFVAEIKKIY